MHKVLIFGAGKVGALIATLLQASGDYQITLADKDFSGADHRRLQEDRALHKIVLDITQVDQITAFLDTTPQDAVISCLPYFCNPSVARLAKQYDMHYFDLTEDITVTDKVRDYAKQSKKAFVPQCGLAPGFITIAAHTLMKQFDEVDTVKMRVGALPVNVSNALQYALTWSIDGLINEYGNPCYALEEGHHVKLQPLEGLETIEIDGITYEAFNTSGGLGSLATLYAGKVNTMNYKTMRYPGHCQKMRFLMNDLDLNHDRETLKKIFKHVIPTTYRDVVVIYISVVGIKNGTLLEENCVYKLYPKHIAGDVWSAIQVTTGSGICTIVDLVLKNPEQYQGIIFQEHIDLQAFLDNRFGQYYQQ